VILRIVIDLLQAYLACIFIRIVFTWFPLNPWGNAAKVLRVLERITDPLLVPIRRIVPPLRVGGLALDLSPLIVLIGLEVVLGVLRSYA
jgi:YggT family protein